MIDTPPPVRPDRATSARFRRQPTKDTRPEMELRRALHTRGLRFRVQVPVPGRSRRKIDLAFTRAKLAVLVDGCFWHGCPTHGEVPATNTAWWAAKLEANRARDLDTGRALQDAGWTVIRVWEHMPPEEAADIVEATYRDLIRGLGS